MRLLVTGTTGALGAEVVPRLVAQGHEIDAVVRISGTHEPLVSTVARVVSLDVFDPAAVRSALHGVDGIVHLATSIPPLSRMHRAAAWATNDRLRDEATRTLVDAALAADVEAVVFPSITFNYADGGDSWLDEDAPLDPPFAPTRSALAAEGHLARFTSAGRRGVVLRLARLYGPGRASAEVAAMARHGRMIVIGRGANLVSSLHVEDAGSALAAGIRLPAGIYNVADDRPRTALELAEATVTGLAGRGIRRVPTPLARILLGSATRLLTVSQRVDAGRLRRATGWQPRHPDASAWWREAHRWFPDETTGGA
jgi:nucleoside-diphosphate-sugar epimerase